MDDSSSERIVLGRPIAVVGTVGAGTTGVAARTSSVAERTCVCGTVGTATNGLGSTPTGGAHRVSRRAHVRSITFFNWAITNTLHTRTLHFLPHTRASLAVWAFLGSLYKRVKRQGRAAGDPSASILGALSRWCRDGAPRNRRRTIAVILWLDVFVAGFVGAGDERTSMSIRVSLVIIALAGLFRASQLIQKGSRPHHA